MKKSAYLLMGLLAAIVVAVGVVACSGNGNKENNENRENNSFANFRTGDSRENRNNQAVRNERPANNDDKLVGRWKLDDKEYADYLSMVYVFNRDNTGYGEMKYTYGKWSEPYRIHFSYRYDNRKSEITIALEERDIETIKIEWFGDNRFYVIDRHGDQQGPFVRQ